MALVSRHSFLLNHCVDRVMTMWNVRSRFRLMPSIIATLFVWLAGASSVPAAEPSAAGLWQKIEDGKPVIYVLVVEHNGIFEGVIAKTFPLPGEDESDEVCSKCTDDRKN